MLEPSEYLAYVYYKCSKCNEVGDEVRVRETKSGIHICMFCGNEDKIKPITEINFNYQQHKESNKSSNWNTIPEHQKVIKSIMSCGWSKSEANEAVINVLNKTSGDVSPQELFRLSIIQLDEQQTKTD